MPTSQRTSELKLPTMAVAVRLALAGAEPRMVEMFVPEVRQRGPVELFNGLAAVLDGEAPFLPVRGAAGVQLLAKHAIAWVAVARHVPVVTVISGPAGPSSEPAEGPMDELTLFDHQHLVDIELVGGGRLTGTMLDSEPEDHARLVDHLNRGGRFLRIWTPEEHFLINALQVVAVTELGEVW